MLFSSMPIARMTAYYNNNLLHCWYWSINKNNNKFKSRFLEVTVYKHLHIFLSKFYKKTIISRGTPVRASRTPRGHFGKRWCRGTLSNTFTHNSLVTSMFSHMVVSLVCTIELCKQQDNNIKSSCIALYPITRFLAHSAWINNENIHWTKTQTLWL